MPIRVRLALWCAALACVLLSAVAAAVYAVHSGAHYRDVDRVLSAVAEHYRSEADRLLSSGRPLDGDLTPIDQAGSSLVGVGLAVVDDEGNAVVGRPVEAAAFPVGPGDAPHGPVGFATVPGPSGRIRVHTMPLGDGDDGSVQVSASLADLDRSIERFRNLLIVAMVTGVVVSGLGSFATAERALRPVAELTETARAISLSRAFGRRIERADARDELGELARTFNEMLASLHAAHEGQRRFLDDAAHELRAPVTSLLGNLELVERARDLPEAERAEIITDVRIEAERLARLVNDLLVLARADAGQRPRLVAVELDRLVVAVVREARPIADGVALGVGALEPVVVGGNADRLQQLLLILVENALRYTPPGGRVSVTLGRQGSEAILSVRDTGIGIDPEDMPRIFDRFFRADPARARIAGGTGLGLAIAKWIAEVHNGRIEVESTPGVGSVFRVVLPVTVAMPAVASAEEPGANGPSD